jgi:hypothetical protein
MPARILIACGTQVAHSSVSYPPLELIFIAAHFQVQSAVPLNECRAATMVR